METAFYTAGNCTAAYQLRWSLSLFPTEPIPAMETWYSQVSRGIESQGIRILECTETDARVLQLLLSTIPRVRPAKIVKHVKGRLQHEIRNHCPKAFRRNFSLTSVGSAARPVVENYVRNQLNHHVMIDSRMDEMLRSCQLHLNTDLSKPQYSAHGRYIYNLHLCLLHAGRSVDLSLERLAQSQKCVLQTAQATASEISVYTPCADHLHLTVGCCYQHSPEEIALAFMNGLAAIQQRAWLEASFYVGTFGEYDMNAIWRQIESFRKRTI